MEDPLPYTAQGEERAAFLQRLTRGSSDEVDILEGRRIVKKLTFKYKDLTYEEFKELHNLYRYERELRKKRIISKRRRRSRCQSVTILSTH